MPCFFRTLTVLFSLILGVAGTAFAKSWDGYANKAASMRVGFVSPALKQYLSNPGDPQSKSLNFEPNITSKFGVGVSYEKIGLTTTFSQPPNATREANYGKTTAQDYQLRFFGDVHSYDFFYQRYSGFYIRNSNDVDPTYAERQDKIQRPDLDIEHYGFQYFYNFHPDRFHPGYFDQTAIPKQSGGALMGLVGVNHHRVSADSPLVPSTLTGTYGAFENFKGGEFLTAKVGAAGGYCFTGKGFFLTGMLLLTGGQQKQTYELIAGEKTEKTIPQTSIGMKLSAGFNIRNFFLALNMITDTTNFNIENALLNASTNDSSFWLGLRF